MNFLRRLRRPRTLPSLEAYAHWAASYPPHAHNALMRAEEDALLALLPPLAGRVVLDAACGSGRLGRLALARGARRVISLDNSPHMLAVAPLPEPAVASLAALPLAAACVDVVLCGLAVGHLPASALGRALSEMARLLTPEGVALVSDVHPFLFLSGAQRTFSSGGHTYAVEHHVHLYSDMHAHSAAAGLRIDAVAEPRLLPADRADGPAAPVAIVYRLRRT